jgi:hypothetical protein
MRLEITPSAIADLLESHSFYERMEKGLGTRFLAFIHADIESLLSLPERNPITVLGLHKMLCRRFPFSIFYRIAGQTVTVYAVIDGRRDPAWISSRLQQPQKDPP